MHDRISGVDHYASKVTSTAAEIMDEIGYLESESKANLWDYGTAMEAAVALNNEDAAYHWAKLYVNQPTITAFALSGTIRQFEEIWSTQGNSDLPQKIIPALQHSLVKKVGGNLALEDILLDDDGFQAIYGDQGPTAISFLQNILTKTKSVVHLLHKGTKVGYASGLSLIHI